MRFLFQAISSYLSEPIAINMEDVWDPKLQNYEAFLKKFLDLDLEMAFQGQVVVETRFFF